MNSNLVNRLGYRRSFVGTFLVNNTDREAQFNIRIVVSKLKLARLGRGEQAV